MLLLGNNCFGNIITIYVIFEVMKKSPLEEFFSKAAILIFYFSTSIQLRGQTKTNTLPTMYMEGIVFAWLAFGTPEGTRTPNIQNRNFVKSFSIYTIQCQFMPSCQTRNNFILKTAKITQKQHNTERHVS